MLILFPWCSLRAAERRRLQSEIHVGAEIEPALAAPAAAVRRGRARALPEIGVRACEYRRLFVVCCCRVSALSDMNRVCKWWNFYPWLGCCLAMFVWGLSSCVLLLQLFVRVVYL